MMTKRCIWCFNAFEATRSDARYCSNKCRQQRHRFHHPDEPDNTSSTLTVRIDTDTDVVLRRIADHYDMTRAALVRSVLTQFIEQVMPRVLVTAQRDAEHSPAVAAMDDTQGG